MATGKQEGQSFDRDWRDSMVRAVAYRMHTKTGIDHLQASVQVRNFMKHGVNSPNAGDVLLAMLDLYDSVIKAFIPVTSQIVSMMGQITEREIINGEAIEVLNEEDQG